MARMMYSLKCNYYEKEFNTLDDIFRIDFAKISRE